MPGFNPVRAVSSLIPEPGTKRPYALATFINSLGFGFVIVTMPLYFTRIVHLSVGSVGLGLSIAATIGLLSGVPIGHLADRRGPLGVAQLTMLLQGLAGIGFLFIRNYAGFLAIATADSLVIRASMAADGALLRRVAGEDGAGFRSSTAAIFNLGLTLGTACSAIALQLGTPTAYHVLIIINSLSYVGAIAALSRLPRYDPLPEPAEARRWGVLTDGPFAAYVALGAVIEIQFLVIPLLIPLWVVDHTNAPRWSVPMFLLLNTILIVLFQVHVGKGVKTIMQGGTAYRRAGVIFLFSCAAIGFATGLPGWAALLLLIAGVSLHTLGELWHQAGSFAISFGLPPAHAQGQYEGFLGIGQGIAGAAAPALLLGVVLTLGRPGVIGLGACFALIGLVMPAVARWGERTRPAPSDVADLEGASAVE